MGDVAVDVGAVEALQDAGLVTIDDAPHAPEHALEVELPFLQRVLEDFTIIPFLVNAVSPEQVALVIETVLGKRTLLVVSTDLSHYLDYASAERRDHATAGTIEQLDYTTLGPNAAPGKHTASRMEFLSPANTVRSTDSFLLLIEFTCAGVTELPSVRYARHC